MTGWHPRPGPGKPAGPEDLYASTQPWDIGRPQPAFLALARTGAITGQVLDAGCGTGEHMLMAAALGLDATGIDLAPAALSAAGQKAAERGLPARFLRWDALRLAELGESFGTVLDCGLFHILGDHDRAACTRSLRSALRPSAATSCHASATSSRSVTGGGYTGSAWARSRPPSGGRSTRSSPPPSNITTSPAGIRAWLTAVTRP